MNGLAGVALPCPHCGETVEVFVDLSVAAQSYTEDCPVCCAPMRLQVTVDARGRPEVAAARDD